MKRTRTDYIVVHCSATSPNWDGGRDEIDRWHRERGWKGIGYHFVIRRNGTLEVGRAVDDFGAHVQGHNINSVGICMVGGIDCNGDPEDNFTEAQWAMLTSLVIGLHLRYPIARVQGHRDFFGVTKACPSFDVAAWWDNQREAYLDAILGAGPARG
jgi:N-acetylmuramoyl-L-alanine amidase